MKFTKINDTKINTYQDASGFNLHQSSLFPSNQKASFQKYRSSFIKISGSSIRSASFVNMFDGQQEFNNYKNDLESALDQAYDGDVFMFKFTYKRHL